MLRLPATILGTTRIVCITVAICACSSDGGGVFPTECNGDGHCNGSYEGTISGMPDSSACSNKIVRFTVAGDLVQFSEFEADCDLATCFRCLATFGGSSTIDADSCALSISHLGQFSLGINGVLDQGSCRVSGTYTFGGPPNCPCLDTGSWSATR